MPWTLTNNDEIHYSMFMSSSAQKIVPDDRFVELWLDLRGTAIPPHEALSLLSQIGNEWGAECSPRRLDQEVDRVLVAEHNSDSEGNGIPPVFCANDKGDAFQSPNSGIGGIVVRIDCEFMDPIPSIQAVSEGKWVILEVNGNVDEGDRLEAISNLVNVLRIGSSPLPLLSDEDGDFDLQSSESNNSGEGGGVAICCKTATNVVSVITMLRSSLLDSLTTTESGILVQEEVPLQPIGDNPHRLKAALLLPLDVLLWNTALTFFD